MNYAFDFVKSGSVLGQSYLVHLPGHFKESRHQMAESCFKDHKSLSLIVSNWND